MSKEFYYDTQYLKETCFTLFFELIAVSVIRGMDPSLYVEAFLKCKLADDEFWKKRSDNVFDTSYKIVFDLIKECV